MQGLHPLASPYRHDPHHQSRGLPLFVSTWGYKLSFGTITDITAILLKLTAGDGVVGWGEANAMQRFTNESADDVARVLGDKLLPRVLNERKADPGYIDQLLDDVQPGDDLLAKGAITMALLDIHGKRFNVPASNLLGGAIRRSLQVSHPLSNGSFEDDIAVIDEMKKQNFVDYMLKMGSPSTPIRDEIARVAALEEYYGDTVKFKADANAGWNFEQAKDFLEGVKNFRLSFVEQPLAKDDINGMAKLTQDTTLLVSADESLTGEARAEEIVGKRAATVFSIKSSNNGGPLRSKTLYELAEKNGIQCYSNSRLEGGIRQAASLQLAVTRPNLLPIGHAFFSTRRLKGDVTNFASFVRDGVVYLPDGDGLGVEVNEAQVRSGALVSCCIEK